MSQERTPPDDAALDRVIDALDEYAREVDHYDYGLPMFDLTRREAMRDIVRVALEPTE